jgi:palmitoyltransferase
VDGNHGSIMQDGGAIGGKAYFYATHAITLLVLLLLPSSALRNNIVYGDVYGRIASVLYLIYAAFCIYVYRNVFRSNPGYLRHVRLIEEEEDVDSRSSAAVANDDVSVGMNGEENTEQNALVSHDGDGAERDSSSGPYRYCRECRRSMPMRCRHCYKCGECVLTFDHHCFFLGNCVGEKNHRAFWWFLFAETVLIVWSVSCYVVPTFQDPSTTSSWMAANWIILLVMINLTPCSILIIGLLWFHSYLILTNQTTYESLRFDQLWYLPKRMSIHALPFHAGWRINLRQFCMDANATAEPLPWRVVNYEDESQATCFRNKYYECC